jgi:SOS-response transcriptional repressor LexA
MAKKYTQLSNILKRLLFKKDMKPVDLARELNIPQPTIHRLVTGKSTRPYKSSLEPIAKYFDVTVDQLIGEDPMLIDWQTPEENKNTVQNVVIKTVPVIHWHGFSDLNAARKNAKKFVAITGNISDDCFAVLMYDHSMEPAFPKGTILIFDPQKKSSDRSYVLVKLDNKETPIFRQLLVDIDHQYLKPLNPDLNAYKMRLLNENDKIIASLFEARNNYSPDDEDKLLEMSYDN